VRDVCNLLNKDLVWDASTNTININDKVTDVSSIQNKDIQEVTQQFNNDDEKIAYLDNAVDKLPINGGYPNSYGLPSTEGVFFVVAKNENDLNIFMSLSEDNKKKFLNDIIQKYIGELIGCNQIHVRYVYNNKKYASMDTQKDAKSIELTITLITNGETIDTIKQFKTSKSWIFYYGTPDKSVHFETYTPTNADETTDSNSVVNNNKEIVGIVALGDLATSQRSNEAAGDALSDISKHTDTLD
jgi:hypothetical protein